MGKDNDRGFKVITAFIKPGFRLRFSPTIIGAENIPKDGAVVIAGNHKNISDQFLVFLATKRVVNYMAKREYFDGALAPLFRWDNKIIPKMDAMISTVLFTNLYIFFSATTLSFNLS